MEIILLIILCIILASGFVLDKATAFIKQLKTKGSAKMNNGFEATLSFVPKGNKKSEDMRNPHYKR